MVGMHPSALIVAASASVPSGEQVISGDVNFNRDGNVLTITQGSQTAIINWDDFSISQGALTQFIQTGSNAAALNRVVTLTPSLIDGTLSANGQIFLINPNGITVGANGVIDTAAFIGATLDVSNEDFLNGGDLSFLGESNAAITNLGSISGDAGVFLFAQQVDNQGSVVSADEVGLASGTQILLQPAGEDSRVSVLVGSTSDTQLDGEAIRNSGEVQAAMVTLNATGSAYSTAVNNTGVIRAQNFDTSGGRVRLTGTGGDIYNSGTIDATGSTGGEIEVTADDVYLTDNALVDASGDFGGGSIKIGGGQQGLDATINNADNLTIGENATLSADALISGSGGTIITYAGQQAVILGTLTALGAGDGSGGFVETSGAEYLVLAKIPELNAGGEWLIDPNDIEIIAGNGAFVGSQVGVGFLNAILTGGITLTLLANGIGPDLGDITLSTDWDFDGTGDNSLVFDAGNDIFINGQFLDSAAGGDTLDLTLNAPGSVFLNDSANLAGGDFIANADGLISQSAGTITANSVSLNASTGIGALGSSIAVSTGTIDADNVTSGGIFIENTSGVDLVIGASDITSVNGDIELVSNGSILSNAGTGQIITTTSGDVSVTANGVTSDVQAAGGFLFIDSIGSVSLTAGRDILLGTSGSWGDIDSGGNLTLDAGRNITIDNVTWVDVEAAGDLEITAVGTFDLNSGRLQNNFGDISVTANTVTQSANITASGDVRLDSASAITMSSSAQTSGGDIRYDATTNVALGVLSASDAVSVVAGGDITDATGGSSANIIGARARLEAGGSIGTAVASEAVGISVANVEAIADTNVYLESSQAVTIGGVGDISVGVDVVPDPNLTGIEATNGVIDIQSAGALTVEEALLAGTDVSLATSTGSISINADVDSSNTILIDSAAGIAQSSGTLTAQDLGVLADGAVSGLVTEVSNLAVQKTGAGSFELTNTGTLTIADLSALEGSLATTSITGDTDSTITAGSPITFAVNTTTNTGSGNTFTYTSSDDGAAGADDITINSGVTVSETTGSLAMLSGDSVVVDGDISAAEDITLQAGVADTDSDGSITQDAASSIAATTGTVTLTTDTGVIDLAGSIDSANATAGAIAITNTGAGNTITLGTINQTNAAGGVTVTSEDAINQTAGTSITSAGSFSAATTLAATGDVTIADSDGNVNFQNDPALLPGGTLVGGDLDINTGAAGAVTDSADADDANGVAVAGLLTVTGGSTVTLDDPNNSVTVVGSGGSGDVTISRAGVVDLGTTVNAATVTGITGDLVVESKDDGVAFTAIQNGAAITLNEAGNNFNNVAFSTDVAAGSTFVSNAETGITQSVAVTFATPATSSATFITEASTGNNLGVTRGSILINNAANDLAGTIDFDVQETSALALGDVSIAHGGAADIDFATSTLLRNLTIQTTTSGVTQSGVITASGTSNLLTASVAGSLDLGSQINSFSNATGALGNVTVGGDFAFQNDANLGQSFATLISAASGIVDLSTTAGNITQGFGAGILADSLVVRTPGSVILSNSGLNNVTTFAGLTTGAVDFEEVDGFTVGSVTALDTTVVDGITTTDANVTLTTFGGITLAEDITPGTANVVIDAQSAIAQTGGAIIMDSGSLKLSGLSIGAVGTPLLTQGSYTIQSQAFGGDLVIQNDVSGDVTVGTIPGIPVVIGGGLVSSGGVVSLTNTVGDISLNRAVSAINGVTLNASGGAMSNSAGQTVNSAAGTIDIDALTTVTLSGAVGDTGGSVIDINAGTDLAINPGANIGTASATDITLTSGGTMALGANVGANGTTTNATINNTGTLTRTIGTVSATNVILQGNGGVGGAAATNELTTNASTIDFQKAATTDLVRIQNNSGAAIEIAGTIGGDFVMETNGGSDVTIGAADLNLSNTLGGSVAEIRSGSSILKGAPGNQIIVGGTDGTLILRTNSGSVGTLVGHAQGDVSTGALEIDLDGTLVGNANGGGFYVQNVSTGLLNVNSGTSVLGATNGVNASNGVEINTDGALDVNQAVGATAGFVQLVGNYINGPVTIDAVVSSGAGAGGDFIIVGSPTINVAPTVGIADVYISDQNPTTSILGDLTVNSNLVLSALEDIVIGATLTVNGGGDLTLNADTDVNGNGGIVWISTSALNDGEVILNGGGNLDMTYSELTGDYQNGAAIEGLTITSGTTAGSNSGNSVVFDSDSGNPEIVLNNGGTITLTPRDNLGFNVIQEGGDRSIQGPTSTLVFNGDTIGGSSDGDIGELANPLRTQVANLEITRPLDDGFIREQDGINFSAASTIDNLVLEAATAVDGTIGGNGNITQGAGATLTANTLTISSLNGSVLLDETNSVAQIDNGFATNAFTYSGGVNLIVAGPITSSVGGTTIDVGGLDIDQLEDATIIGNTVELTFGNMVMRDAIGNNSTLSVTINNQGNLTRPTSDTDAIITASVLNINDQLVGGGNIGTGALGEDILTNIAILNFNKQNSVSDMFLRENDSVSIGQTVADTQGDLTLITNNPGDITQSGIITVDGTASFITNEGNILLDTFSSNAISAFGIVTASQGSFAYDGTNGILADGEINFNDLVTTSGGELLGTSTVDITFGGANDLVFAATGDIVSTGDVLITRSALGLGQVFTAGDITTTGDNITFTSADNILNVQLTGDVVHGTGTGVGGNILYDATVDSAVGPFDLTDNAGTGDVTFLYTVGAGANPLDRLEVNTSGTTTFTDDVDATEVLTDWDPAQRGGDTIINGGALAVDTTGVQIYNDNVLLTNANAGTTTLNGGGVEFNGGLESQVLANPVNLVITDSATTRFNTSVGTTNPLQTLTVTSDAIVINGDATAASNNTLTQDVTGITIQTYGTQTYNAANGIFVGGGSTGTTPNTLTTHVAVDDTTAGDIIFNGDLNGLSAGINDLVLTAGDTSNVAVTGDIEFNGSAGTTTEMGDIVITAANNVDITGGNAILSTTFLQEQGFGTTTVSGPITTSSDQTPVYATQPPILAGGGIQINANNIIVNADLTAGGEGRINLNSGEDILISEATVATTAASNTDPTVNNRIDLTAGDDIVIGDAAATADTFVTTVNGNITLTSGNSAALDNADGILIQGSDAADADAIITAGGVDNGDIAITGLGTSSVNILGGDNDGSIAGAFSEDDTTITINNGDLVANAGAGNNAAAGAISGGSQTVNITEGDFIVNGSDTGILGIAGFAATETQDITLTDGDMTLSGGDADAAVAIVAAGSTQNVTLLDGDLTVTGGAGANSLAGMLLAGDADQTVTVSLGDATLQGGTGANASAGIQLDGNGLQTVTIGNDTDDTFGNLSITGGVGDFAFAGIENTGTGNQVVNVDNNLTLLGGTGLEANAAIHQSDTGNQFVTLGGATNNGGNGDLNITGGDGEDADAYILANGALIQNVTVQAGDITLQGNLDTVNNNSDAYIQAFSSDTTQTIAVSGGSDITLIGGNGDNERAQILSGNDQFISATGVISLTGGGAAGNGSYAEIRADGIQDILAGDTNNTGTALNVQGGSSTGNNDYALIIGGTDGTSTQTITTTQGDIILAGNAGNSSAAVDGTSTEFGAAIVNNGLAQTITLNGDGDLSLTGGTEADTAAAIQMTNIAGAQAITVGSTAGNLTLNGGTGEDAYALIRSQGTGATSQSIQVQDSIALNGNAATSSVTVNGQNIGAAIVSDGTQDIDTLTAGSISLTGGTVDNSAALITTTTTGGAQTVTVNGAGDLNITGGVGNNSSAGILLVGDSPQTVEVLLGDATLQGGAGDNSSAGIQLVGNGLQTVTIGNDTDDVNGDLTITGGSGTSAFAGIENTGTGIQVVNVDNNATLTGGTGEDSNAAIHQSGSGDQTVVLGGATNNGGLGDLEVRGGNGLNASAYILANGATTQTVQVQQGDIRVLGNTDSAANGSEAYIQSFSTTTTQIIDVDGVAGDGNIFVTGGTGDDERARILSGNDQDIDASGVLVVRGGNGAGNGSFADVRADGIQDIAVVNTNGDPVAIAVQGGTSIGSDDYALIIGGTDGTSTQTITTTVGDINLSGIQGNSSAPVDGSTTEFGAGIINNGLAQTITLNGAGDLILTGGTIDDSAALIEMTNTAATAVQVITVGATSGDLAMNGGTGEDAYALIRSQGTGITGGDIAQVINVQDNITLNANSATSSVAVDGESIGAAIVSDGSQTIDTLTDGNITLTGGTVTDSAALISSTSATGFQEVTVGGVGNLSVLGGSGQNADAIIRGAGTDQSPTEAAQQITVQNGQLIVTASTTVNGGDAAIDSTNANQSQSIDVNGTPSPAGTMTVNGGAAGTVARISSAGAQVIEVENEIDINALLAASDVDITAVDTQTITSENADIDVVATGTGATVDITAGLAQMIDAATSIDIEAANTAAVVVQNTTGVQNITAGTDITVDADTAGTVLVQADAGTQTIEAGDSIDIDADGAGTIVTVNSLTADQDIDALNESITITANNSAAINVTADTNQTIDAETFIDVNASNSSQVLVEARTGTQGITARTGDITLDVNGNDFIQVLAGSTQAIDATEGSIIATVNTGGITIQNDAGTQDLTAGTNIVIDVTNGAATVEATDGDQSLLAVGDIDVDVNSGLVRIESVTSEQDIIADTGDVTFDGINGATINVLAGSNQLIEATLGSIIGNINTGSLTIQNDVGTQELDADVDIVLNVTSGAITVEATDGSQTLTATNDIDMDSSSGSIRVESVTSDQTLTAEEGDLTIDLINGSSGQILAGTTQLLEATEGNIAGTVNVGGLTIQNDLGTQDLLAGASISLDVTNGSAVVEATNGSQTLTAGDDIDVDVVSGSVTIDSVTADQTLTATAGDITFDVTNGSASVLAETTQLLQAQAATGSINGTVNTGALTIQNTSDTQQLLAGQDITLDVTTGSGLIQALDGAQTLRATNGLISASSMSASNITIDSTNNTQTIDAVDGAINLNSQVNSGLFVTSLLTQDIDAQTTIDITSDTTSSLLVESTTADQSIVAETGDITIQATGASGINVLAATTQAIEATAGELIVSATDSSTVTIRNTSGAQTLTAGTDIDIDSTNLSGVLVQADSGLQTITAENNVELNGNNAGVTLRSALADQIITATTGDITIDGIAGSGLTVEAATGQTLDAARNIAVDMDASALTIRNNAGPQLLDAENDVTVVADTGSTVIIESVDGLQTVNAGGLIDLAADSSTIIVDSLADDQVLTSVGVTNLTGVNGGTVDVYAINSTLNNAGGVWTDDVQVGQSGLTETVTINNSGAITVADVDPAHIHIIADAGAETIFFNGVGSVGATDPTLVDDLRVVTSAGIIDFGNAAKDLALDERVGDVAIEGVANSINLILSSTGSLTDSAAIAANTATLLTTDGDIDLGSSEIVNFQGVIANGNITIESIIPAATFSNRAVSADIPAGEGIYATGNIEIIAAGDITIAADAVRSTGGNILFDTNLLTLDAASATAYDPLLDISGPTDPLGVGTITTDVGTQTFESEVVLSSNTQIVSADEVIFNNTLIGPAGLQVDGDARFNDAIGSLNNPLGYLVLNSDDTQFNFDSGATDPSTLGLDDTVLTAIIGGSFINNGTVTVAPGLNYTFITDANTFGTESNPDAVFQGGNFLGTDAADITIFAGAIDSISFLSLAPSYPSFYASWQIENEFTGLTMENGNLFQIGAYFYRDPLNPFVERDRERIRRVGNTKTAEVAYEESAALSNLAGNIPSASGRAGGVQASSYSQGSAGVTQTVFEDVVILP